MTIEERVRCVCVREQEVESQRIRRVTKKDRKRREERKKREEMRRKAKSRGVVIRR